jgi:drug/metabolite transporter (DMT)-like permease
LAQLDGFTLTVLRYGLAVMLFVGLLWWKEGRSAFSWENHRGTILIGGGLGMGGSALLVFLGLSMTKPELAVIILALQPGMTALGQWAMSKRRPSGFTLLCLVFAFSGVVVAITRGGASLQALSGTGANLNAHASAIFTTGSAQWDQLLGEGLVFLGALAWVTYVLASSRLAHWSALRIATVNCIPAVMVMLVAWLIAMAAGLRHWPAFEVWNGWLGIKVFYLSFFGVFLAMIVFNEGARRIGPLNASLLLNLMPLITFAFRAMEGASFERSELVGACMVVGALVANNVYQRRQSVRS